MEKYERLSELGHGGFGTVYKVRRISDDELFAMKVTKIDIGHGIGSVREVDIMSRIRHSNIMKLIDTVYESNVTFSLIMPLGGVTLYDYMKDNENMSMRRRMRLFYEISSALSLLHRNRIAYADLKPNNILMMDDKAVLIDFGKVIHLPSAEIEPNVFRYEAPEVHLMNSQYFSRRENMRRDPGLNHIAVDRWALGCMLYFIVTGEEIFKKIIDKVEFIVASRSMLIESDLYLISSYVWSLSSFNKSFTDNEGVVVGIDIDNVMTRIGFGYSDTNKDMFVPIIIEGKEYMIPSNYTVSSWFNDRGIDSKSMISLLSSLLSLEPSRRLLDLCTTDLLKSYGYDSLIPGSIIVQSPLSLGYCHKTLPIIIEWLIEVADRFHLQIETIFLTIDLLYRVFPHIILNDEMRNVIQLLGITCLMIADKLIAVHSPRIDDYVYISNKTYTNEQIVDMEYQVIKVTSGSLYTDNLFTYAFSLQSLVMAWPILMDCAVYANINPAEYMLKLSNEESMEERENRKSKYQDISKSGLLGMVGFKRD